MDEIDHTFRQIQVIQHFQNQLCAQRSLRRWFEDEGIAAYNRHRQEPEWHHGGKVKGRDGDENSRGLAHSGFIDARTDIFYPVIAHQKRNAQGEIDAFDAPAHLTPRLIHGFAIFDDDGSSNFFKPIFHLDFEVMHVLRSAQQRGLSPFSKTGPSCLDSAIHIGLVRLGAESQQLTSGWIVHWQSVDTGSVHPFTIDVILDSAGHSSAFLS